MFKGVIETLKTVLGESLTYKGISDSHNHPFTGVFDENFVELHPDTGERISDQAITILTLMSDLPELPPHRAEIMRGGQSFLVRHCEPDGKGGVRIFLMEND